MCVGGASDFAVDRCILTQIAGSKLAKQFGSDTDQKMIDGRVFVDRDPEAFRLLLLFLRNNR